MEKEPIGNNTIDNMMQFLTEALNEYNERCKNLGKQMTSTDKRLKFIGSALPSLLIWQKWRQERKIPNKMKIDELIALQLKYRRLLKMQEKNKTLNTNTCTPPKFKDKFTHQLDCISKLKNYILEEKLIKKKIDALVIKEQELQNVVEKLSTSSPQLRTVKTTPRLQKDISVTSNEKYSKISKARSLDIYRLPKQSKTYSRIDKCDESTSLTMCPVSDEEDIIGDIVGEEIKYDNISEKILTENELCNVVKKLSCAITTLEKDKINDEASLLSIIKEVKGTLELAIKKSYVSSEPDPTTVTTNKIIIQELTRNDIINQEIDQMGNNTHLIKKSPTENYIKKSGVNALKIKDINETEETIVIKSKTAFAKEETGQIREMEKERDIGEEKLQIYTKEQCPIKNIFERLVEHTAINYKILESATERLARKTQMLVKETQERESEEKFVVDIFLDNEKPEEIFDKNDEQTLTEEKVKIYQASETSEEILRKKTKETPVIENSKIYQAGGKTEEVLQMKVEELLTNEKVKIFPSDEEAEKIPVKEGAEEVLLKEEQWAKVRKLIEVTKQNSIGRESEQSVETFENKEVDLKNRKNSNPITITESQTSEKKGNEKSVYTSSISTKNGLDECSCTVCKCMNCKQLIANIFFKVSSTLLGVKNLKTIEKDGNVEDHSSSLHTELKSKFDNYLCKSICNCSTCNQYTKNIISKISRNLSSIEQQIIEPNEPNLNRNVDYKSDRQTDNVRFDDIYTRSKKQFDKLDPEIPTLDSSVSENNSKLLHKCNCREEILQEALSILISNADIDNSTKEIIQMCFQSLSERIKNLNLNESIDCPCSSIIKNTTVVRKSSCSCRPCPSVKKNLTKCTCNSPCPCTVCTINSNKNKEKASEKSECTCRPCIPFKKNLKKCTCSSPCPCTVCTINSDKNKEEASKKSECTCRPCIPFKKNLKKCTCSSPCPCTVCAINSDKNKEEASEKSECTCRPCPPFKKNLKKCTCSSPCPCSICVPKNENIKGEITKKSECSCRPCIPAKKKMEKCSCKPPCSCTICKLNGDNNKIMPYADTNK